MDLKTASLCKPFFRNYDNMSNRSYLHVFFFFFFFCYFFFVLFCFLLLFFCCCCFFVFFFFFFFFRLNIFYIKSLLIYEKFNLKMYTCTTIHRYPIFSTRYSVMCKVYTGYYGTREIEHDLCTCTVVNPLA